VTSERTLDNRLVLRFKDGPFEDPFLSQLASDGTKYVLNIGPNLLRLGLGAIFVDLAICA